MRRCGMLVCGLAMLMGGLGMGFRLVMPALLVMMRCLMMVMSRCLVSRCSIVMVLMRRVLW